MSPSSTARERSFDCENDCNSRASETEKRSRKSSDSHSVSTSTSNIKFGARRLFEDVDEMVSPKNGNI
ncbi:hypothetical protein M3Y96_00103400 [Aphelenchoides besseyi]|nr:hypothetical protein M3Y96_00103400 [Aphelenchoides besseyi]